MGQRAPLSPSMISCLGQHFKAMYEPFGRQNLAPSRADRLVYIWADGVRCKASVGAEKACSTVLIGTDSGAVRVTSANDEQRVRVGFQVPLTRRPVSRVELRARGRQMGMIGLPLISQRRYRHQ